MRRASFCPALFFSVSVIDASFWYSSSIRPAAMRATWLSCVRSGIAAHRVQRGHLIGRRDQLPSKRKSKTYAPGSFSAYVRTQAAMPCRPVCLHALLAPGPGTVAEAEREVERRPGGLDPVLPGHKAAQAVGHRGGRDVPLPKLGENLPDIFDENLIRR